MPEVRLKNQLRDSLEYQRESIDTQIRNIDGKQNDGSGEPILGSPNKPFPQVDSIALTPILKPYGYELFNQISHSFKPEISGPVDPNYLLGPKDEVIVNIWSDS